MLIDRREAVDHDVFIVHADDDTPFVKGELLPMLGLPDDRVILSSELPFPAFVEQAIENAVRRSRLTLAVLSPAYLRDRWASFAELLSRNANPTHADGGTLVPLLLADCDIPPILAQHETLNCRTPTQREHAAARLRLWLGRPMPRLYPIACPYPGMQPFSAEVASQFHGRTREIDELMGRLQAGEQEIYVIGPSGSGKSSLVAAGIIPRLQDTKRAQGNHFAVRALRPGEYPTQRVAEALECEVSSMDGAIDRLLLRTACARLLVFVDQLEELFVLTDAVERQTFTHALRVLRDDHRCQLIMALRADFYGALMSSELWPDVDGRFTRLEIAPLHGEALRTAIEAPAREVGVYLEHVLVERLMTDAAAEPGALPLLQEALVLLWGRRSHRLLRLASYEELGSDGRSGLAVAMAQRADATLHKLTSPQQRLARRILLRLVSFGEGRPDTRRQQPRAALATSGDDAADVDDVIRRLIDERMLTADATARGEPLIDLAHEALIAGWPEFQRWLRSRREDEQRRRLFELHSAEWVKRGCGSSGLFDASELAEAERWIAGETAHELGYSDDLPRFLAASRDAIEAVERQEQLALEQREAEHRAAQDERARMRRRLARFAMLIFILFLALGLVAWRERTRAQLQLGINEQERGKSLLFEGHDPASAILHLIEAVNLGIDNETLRTILAAVRHSIWNIAIRHGAPVSTVAFSPDGTRMITASHDSTARIWDAVTGAPLGSPLQHGQAVHSAAFSPDGTRAVTASWDGTARIWDATTGAPVSEPLHHEQAVNSAAFSPDGTRVVTASGDCSARIWDASTGVAFGEPLHHKQAVNNAMFSPDGTRIVTASDDGTAQVWDAATGTPLGESLKHKEKVRGAAFSPDGFRVVTASSDHTARTWDAATGTSLGEPLKHEKDVLSAAFSLDGMRVVTASKDGTARVWDATTGTPHGRLLQHGQSVRSAAFSTDGTRVVTASDDGTARVWDAATGSQIGSTLEHDQAVTSAAFSPDGTRIATASASGTVHVWNAVNGALPGGLVQHEQAVISAAFNGKGTAIVTASQDGTARVWNADGAPLGGPLQHKQAITSAAFDSGGTRIVTASGDGTARVWNAATGAPIGEPLKHGRTVTTVAFSPDGKRIVTASHNDTAQIWDATTGQSIGKPLQHTRWVTSAVFSPESDRVLTTSDDGTARVWDAATGDPFTDSLRHAQAITSAAFSPDGKRVVTGSFDGTVHVWDATAGTPIGQILHHAQAVTSATFSPDGQHILTASEDATAQTWDATTGLPLGRPLQHAQAVLSAAFSPDGGRIVTASEDGTVRLWDATTGTSIAGPWQHAQATTSAAISPDGKRIVTAGCDSTPRVWSALETGPLSTWVEQATSCVVPAPQAVGSSVICSLSVLKEGASRLFARVHSMRLSGDAATFSRVWRLSRVDYQQALAVLDKNQDWVIRSNQRDAEALRQTVRKRLAILEALEGHLPEARTQFGSDAPGTDALLLNRLAMIAHDEFTNDGIALPLLLRAHDLIPDDASIMANLAEVYFAAGQHEAFTRDADEFDKLDKLRPSSPGERVAMATLAWATAHLTKTPEGPHGERLLRTYQKIENGTRVKWTWTGARHALQYGRFHVENVAPVLDVLALLEEPVSDQTRAELARLVEGRAPGSAQPQLIGAPRTGGGDTTGPRSRAQPRHRSPRSRTRVSVPR